MRRAKTKSLAGALGALAVIAAAAWSAESPTTSRTKMTLNSVLDRIFAHQFCPFSMKIAGRDVRFIATTARNARREAVLHTTLCYRAEGAPLLVYLDLCRRREPPAVSMSMRLRAEKNLTDCINDIHIADIPIGDETGGQRLAGITGGFFEIPDFPFPPESLKYYERTVGPGGITLDSGLTGRSSNSIVPLWVYSLGAHGLWFGPEWSGCWRLTLGGEGAERKLRLGLPTLDFALHQGEEIQLPAFAMGSYRGGVEDGLNTLRRAIRQHYLREIQGRKPVPQVIFQGLGALEKYQDEETLYLEADRASEIGCEAFVLDAGWYHSPATREWGNVLGDWEPHPERFPNGMRKFADYIHRKGMRFGLWIEPRVGETTASGSLCRDFLLARNEPAEVPRHRKPSVYLVDLGNRAGEEWFEGQIEKLIAQYGADWIWFDFNANPRELFFSIHEDERRKGLMEISFYAALYRIFERVQNRHPDVWIETCASGGRCIDLGMLKRSQSIWVNDYSGLETEVGQPSDDDINRNFRSSLNKFLPAVYVQNGLCIPNAIKQSEEVYGAEHYLTHFGGALQFLQGLCHWKRTDLDTAKRFVELYKQYRTYLEQDYYEMFDLPTAKNTWDGWQFHDPARGEGILFLFKLAENAGETVTVTPRAIRCLARCSFKVLAGSARVKKNEGSIAVNVEHGRAVFLAYTSSDDAGFQE